MARTNHPNTHPNPDFSGYSPHEMSLILYQLFDNECPIQLRPLLPEQAVQSPLMRLLVRLLLVLDEAGELQQTQRGYLPRRVVDILQPLVAEMEIPIAHGIVKLVSEGDSLVLALVRHLLQAEGCIKVRKGKISMTKKGGALLADPGELFARCFRAHFYKTTWGSVDAYHSPEAGQLGFGYTVYLLSRFGSVARPVEWYGEKYLQAFPALLQSTPEPRFGSVAEHLQRCYAIRSFDRCLAWWGLVALTQPYRDTAATVKKTALFDAVFAVREPLGLN